MKPRSIPVPSSTGRTKWFYRCGSNYHRPLKGRELLPYFKAVRYVLRWGRYQKDKDVCDLLREFESFLKSCPAIPQRSIRGTRPKIKAAVILRTIYNQGLKHKFRPQDAALRILSRAIAAELCPKPTSAPFYNRIQVVRAVMRLMKSEFLVLYGKKLKFRISRQGKWTTEHLYAMLRKQYSWFLTEGRKAQIRNSRWIQEQKVST